MQVALRLSTTNKGNNMSDNTWETLAVHAKFCPHALASLCNVSLRTLQRRFDRTYGMPVGHWMRQLRLQQAYGRIAAGESVKCVAYDLHFKQLSHFSRVFKEAYGVAPTLVSPQGARRHQVASRLAVQLPAPMIALPGANLAAVLRTQGLELNQQAN
jgi:AraC-like DNA-binding protein